MARFSERERRGQSARVCAACRPASRLHLACLFVSKAESACAQQRRSNARVKHSDTEGRREGICGQKSTWAV
eukprot:4300733-Pleurochrysis_carterae.AAC.2